MCRRNGSPAPRKRDERPLNIASRRRMTGWCKQSVERLPSRQTQSKVLAVMRARTPRPQCGLSAPNETARSARELCGIDSASEKKIGRFDLRNMGQVGAVFSGKRERAWLWRSEARSPSGTIRLFEHRRLSMMLLDALVVRGAHNSRLVTYLSQKLRLGLFFACLIKALRPSGAPSW
ncbi:hypothetical protein DFH11DRAFT_1615302 [Phellopilus nigrolimitatus]|nr:hypothetical protein DFH11DRAFT_1615302 [Phellopilus nigrolimitatus]